MPVQTQSTRVKAPSISDPDNVSVEDLCRNANYIIQKKETKWMLAFQTVYPYGLNDRVGDECMTKRY